jgi:hypothetical protein
LIHPLIHGVRLARETGIKEWLDLFGLSIWWSLNILRDTAFNRNGHKVHKGYFTAYKKAGTL